MDDYNFDLTDAVENLYNIDSNLIVHTFTGLDSFYIECEEGMFEFSCYNDFMSNIDFFTKFLSEENIKIIEDLLKK